MINILIFILGLVIGSFLNCVVYRTEKKRTFLKGRSFCPHCKHVLSWQDLIPVFSFLILKGKCRYCRKKISFQYPLIELATALLFVLIINLESSILNIIFLFIISAFLIIIFVYDLKHLIIPDKFIYPAIVISFIYQLINLRLGILNNILAGLAGLFLFLSIVIVSHGKWMGVGDVKLVFLIGLLLGWPEILVALFISFFSGAIIGIGLISAKKKGLKSEVPFGPFLVFGTFIALFWAVEIIQYYFNLFIL